MLAGLFPGASADAVPSLGQDAPVAESGWEGCAFRGELRHHQGLALDFVEQERAAGRGSAYLVLPPGAGKTVVGLEVARRLGRRTLVLTPHTVVHGQWLEKWQQFAAPDQEPPLTVLTTSR